MNKALTGAKIFFFISGFTALVYEVVWLRLLGLVFGNTTFAVSTVLAAYMAGLGFGGYFLGALAERWKRPLRSYGLLELAVAVYAIATPWLVLGIQWVYVYFGRATDASDGLSIALRLFLSFFVVFIPTFFMGGTLPALIKFFLDSDRSVGVTTARLYSLNTAGALAGTVAAGFFLLPALGSNGTLVVAVLLNLCVGGLAVLLSAELENDAHQKEGSDTTSLPSFSRPWLGVAMFVSGLTAMVYEVSWTRILAAVLGSSTYAFTVMLATFLLGLSLGSVVWKRVLVRFSASGRQWGWLCLAISSSALFALPLFPWVNVAVVRLCGLTFGHPQWLFASLSLLCAVFMTLPAFFFGALFPVSAALYAPSGSSAPQRIGRLYFWNTLGNIAGSLGAGFLLIPWIGIHDTLRVAIFLGAFLAAVASWAAQKKRMHNSILFILAASVMVSVLGANEGWDKRLVCSGMNYRAPKLVAERTQDLLAEAFGHDILYYREGLNSIVNVGQWGNERYLKVNGKVDASSFGDMSTQLLLGHLPHLLHPAPKRSLIIGFGSGVTLAASLEHPVERVDCAEIEPAVLEAAPFFQNVNRNALKDPRAHIYINDGRNHLLLQKEKYDVISSEPSNPWMAGVATLFTTDFYRLAESRLAPRGVFCQWINGYAISPEDFWMVVASLASVFGHVTVWRATPGDFLLIAQREPFVYDLDRIDERFRTIPQLHKDLEPYAIGSGAGLLARFQLGESSTRRFLDNSPLHTDDRLSLEFSAPMALYNNDDRIAKDITRMATTEPLPGFTGGLEAMSKSASRLRELGEASLNMQRAAEALRWFEQALVLEPDRPELLTGLGRSLGQLGRTADAMKLLERAGTADAFLSMAKIRRRESDHVGASGWIEKASESSPDDLEVLYLKGQIMEDLGLWAKALEAYEQYGRSVPGNVDVELSIARMNLELGNAESSIGSLEALRKLTPSYFPVYPPLSRAYRMVERPLPAIAAFERYLALNPYNKPAWVDLMGLYLKAGLQDKLDEATKRISELSLV